MTKEEAKIYYQHNYNFYSRLAENLKQALTSFLEENEIAYHSISYRIKEFNSYYEKIDRKNYNNPSEEIEDFCGLRIICFYPEDLEKIGNIINKEFLVKESIDKSSKLEPDRFGYRSNHYIVTIKKEWAIAPNYRNLQEFKAEIQVRTILMHAWADLEHKLAYKKKEQIPEEFRRKLYQLSALLEIADSQFQDLKSEKEIFKKSLVIDSLGEKTFDLNRNLNLDTFQAFLDFYFSNRIKDIDLTRDLLEELTLYNIGLKELYDNYSKLKPYLDKIELDTAGKNGKWAQVGVIRTILDILNDNYFKDRVGKDIESNPSLMSQRRVKGILDWRKRVKNNEIV